MSVDLLPFEHSFRGWMERRGMRWEENCVELGEVGGSCRAFRLYPASQPERVVVAVHGAGNDALFGWVGLFKELLLAGSVVHSFDLPGHGRGGDTLFAASHGEISLRRAVDRTAEAFPGLPVHAVGVSLGGAVLIHALGGGMNGLASAAAIVAPIEIRLSVRTILPEISPRVVQLLWREREHYGLSGLVPSFGPFKRDVYPLRLDAQSPKGAFGYVATLNEALAEMKLEEAASRIAQPVLLAYGVADRVVPLEQGERLDRTLANSELLRVPGGTHLSTPLSPLVRDKVLDWVRRWE